MIRNQKIAARILDRPDCLRVCYVISKLRFARNNSTANRRRRHAAAIWQELNRQVIARREDVMARPCGDPA